MLGNIFLLLGADADAAQKPKAYDVMKRANWQTWTGENLVWGINVQIIRGCLEESAETVAAGFDASTRRFAPASNPRKASWRIGVSTSTATCIYSGGYGEGFSR